MQKIEQTFHSDDVKCILQTRIPQNPVRDKIAWSLTNNGLYTVKSGYRHWQSSQRDVSEVNVVKGWKRIWSLEIPHKSQIFLWRFCKNNIPVRNLLRGKGINCPISCPMCNRDIEHILHLFFDCEFDKECLSKTDLTFDMTTIEFGADWLLNKLNTESNDNLITITRVLTGIWFARNRKVWEEKGLEANMVMELSSKQINDWQEANMKNQMFVPQNHSRGEVKLNGNHLQMAG